MSDYTAKVKWVRTANEAYTDSKYSRSHLWLFDGGAEVAASSSPKVVPLPWSVEANVDPEEAFVASLASCHMLFFLSFAASKGIVVDDYTDNAIGIMATDSDGKTAMTEVKLRPLVSFSGAIQPTPQAIQDMHQQAHEECFIANSVKTLVVVDPVIPKQ